MRFIENGPSIPDELLLARDQGRVVFFCGSGVSRAKVNLPDFFGLAKKVIESLGVASDSPVRKVLEEAWNVHKNTKVPGLISADRLFGLLEMEFFRNDIENAVANNLRSDNPDLAAHQIMIELATTQTGLVRLVTTNFDRLFNNCDEGLKNWQPPNLPNLARPKDFNGIVYLHGRASEDYSCAEEDGFILSSAEFGRAYLSEGWATNFFKEILSKYVVVFVGYSADDPPVHYLLEALSKRKESLERIYAFQEGSKEEARAKWQHKGVESIAYDPSERHKALWDSFELWVERAKDPEAWFDKIIEKSLKGPRKLEPFERGLIAHVISTQEGAKRFANAETPPPSEWLLSFDRYCRYEKPLRNLSNIESDKTVVPFELYCLDSDPLPEKVANDNYSIKREAPDEVWDAFDLNQTDRAELQDNQFVYFRGKYSSTAPDLCLRLRYIGIWISRVAHDPITIWWINRQQELHPCILRQIERCLDQNELAKYPDIAKSWRYLLEANKEVIEEHNTDWYQLEMRLKNEGWGWTGVRSYLECLRPRLRIKNQNNFAPIFNSSEELTQPSIIQPYIYYPNPTEPIDVPTEWLSPIIEGLRLHLLMAIQLESDLNPYSFFDVPSLSTENGEDYIDYSGNASASILLLRISRLFEDLTKSKIKAAQKEYNVWKSINSNYFLRLIIWASRNRNIESFSQVEVLISEELTTEQFWDRSFNIEILLTLQARWTEMSDAGKKLIEARILKGPKKFDNEDENQFKTRRAWSILDRLYWLHKNDCSLNCDIETISEDLKKHAPKWDEKSSDSMGKTNHVKGGVVQTDKNFTVLKNLEPKDVLKKAEALRGETDNFLLEAEPFQGYLEEFPMEAFLCLQLAAKNDEYPEWAWHLFLRSEKRNSDERQLVEMIAEDLCGYPDKAFNSLFGDVASWLKNLSKILLTDYHELFYKLFDKLLAIGSQNPKLFQSSVITNKKTTDWVMVAINSPVSPLIQSLFNDPKLVTDNKKTPVDLLSRVTKFLTLNYDISIYALVICNYNLVWFYDRDKKWAQEHLLSKRDNEDRKIRQAFWAGFFWRATMPNPGLYQELKDSLLTYGQNVKFSNEGYSKVLTGILLSGWKSTHVTTNEPYISNEEFREFLIKCDNSYRTHVLWLIKIKCIKNGGDIEWVEQLITLLKDVWPKQIVAKSPETTTRLVELAFSNKKMFEKTGELILPHLVRLNSRSISSPIMNFEKEEIVQSNPELVLDIVYKILPVDARYWPYKIDTIFNSIEITDPELKDDERMIEIKRQWNSR